MVMPHDIVEKRRAIEALRAGVPNRDVAIHLPPVQNSLVDRFNELLSSIETSWDEERKAAEGFLLAADFGAGKSHWLEYYKHLALENNFVCSKITLNKETPLHDLWKIYRECVFSAELPDRSGNALFEIVPGYDRDKAPYYRQLSVWAEESRKTHPRFSATLCLLDHLAGNEILEKIIAEWTGFPMNIGDLKKALKDIDEIQNYTITSVDRSQVLPYFEFLSRFFKSRGYAGWVILVDETEMISRYSLRQRGRAYAHLAILQGRAKGVNIPGLASVFTTTPDYAGTMFFSERYKDKEKLSACMKETKDKELYQPAKEGMRILEREQLRLETPPRTQIGAIHDKVRALYSDAYGWPAPDIGNKEEQSSTNKMRFFIRSWINAWDLKRLYNFEGETVIDQIQTELGEDPDMQIESNEGYKDQDLNSLEGE
jgi:hypothetical protein